MKLGILTFHDGINYGAYFQVYSMQKFLKENGFNCRIINYKNLGFTYREYKCFLNPKWNSLSSIFRNIIKIIKFKKAHRKLNLTSRIYFKKNLNKLKFDKIIIGSDEVWNFGTKLIGYDLAYFSKGFNADSFISYAPSFGNIQDDKKVPEEIVLLLKNINHISVRDFNSSKIIKSLINQDPKIVLDPTFLTNLNIEATLPEMKDYILIYGHFNNKMIKQVLEYANLKNKKVVSIGYSYPGCYLNLENIDPFQWLGYFINCNCVITTMFHGMIFSILNKKRFCLFSTPYRQNKIGNFLKELCLSENMIDEQSYVKDVLEKKLDYEKIDSIIEKKRFFSESFLINALRS